MEETGKEYLRFYKIIIVIFQRLNTKCRSNILQNGQINLKMMQAFVLSELLHFSAPNLHF